MFIDEFNNTNEDCIILINKTFKSYNVVWNPDMIPDYFYLDNLSIIFYIKSILGTNKRIKKRISIGDILNSVTAKKWLQRKIYYY